MAAWSAGNSQQFNKVMQSPTKVLEADRLWAEKVSLLQCALVFTIHTPPVASWSRCTEAMKLTPLSYTRNLENALSHAVPKPYGTYVPLNTRWLHNEIRTPAYPGVPCAKMADLSLMNFFSC